MKNKKFERLKDTKHAGFKEVLTGLE